MRKTNGDEDGQIKLLRKKKENKSLKPNNPNAETKNVPNISSKSKSCE